ncbi:MAG: hypothetical protein WC405_12210 [Syntrophales bacterium]
MEDAKDNSKDKTLACCRKMCGAGMKQLIRNLISEGVPKERLFKALETTESELETTITAINDECRRSRQTADKDLTIKKMRQDNLTRVLVHYLKESDTFAHAVYFPRQSFKIFAEAVRRLLGDSIIEEKQLQCYAVVKAYQDKDGQIDWEGVYVDDRTKQITWDVFFRISKAISGLSGDWFREYIADYANTQGGFHGEGMANYVQERLEGIAKTFKAFRLDR